jgi:hypothetical protein
LSHGGDDCALWLGRVALQGGLRRCTNVAVRVLETRLFAMDRTVTARTARLLQLAKLLSNDLVWVTSRRAGGRGHARTRHEEKAKPEDVWVQDEVCGSGN